MSDRLELTVSASIDAPKLARRFMDGISRRYALEPALATSLKILASDAASDATRSRHSLDIRVATDESRLGIVMEGAGFGPPAVVSPPEGLSVTGDERSIRVEVMLA